MEFNDLIDEIHERDVFLDALIANHATTPEKAKELINESTEVQVQFLLDNGLSAEEILDGAK